MELQVVVEALGGKLDEVADVDGGVLARQLHADVALGGFDDGDLIAGGLIRGSVQSHGTSPFLKRAPTFAGGLRENARAEGGRCFKRIS